MLLYFFVVDKSDANCENARHESGTGLINRGQGAKLWKSRERERKRGQWLFVLLHAAKDTNHSERVKSYRVTTLSNTPRGMATNQVHGFRPRGHPDRNTGG